MTSPVDTTVKYVDSSMINAPVLNGVAGSLITVLDAVLVNGWDSKTLVSLAVVSGVATATFAGTHSATVDSVIRIAGVTGTQVALNGEQKVTGRPSATTVTFATAAADGAAAGTITMDMAPLGWAKPYNGTNLAVYQSQSPFSPKNLLRVDDTTTTYANVRGYEAMSDVNTGTGPFPNLTAPSSNWCKRTTAAATAVPWRIIGDGRFFFYIASPGAASATAFNTFPESVRGFGDPITLRTAGDNFNTLLNVHVLDNVPNNMYQGDFTRADVINIYCPRLYTGLGGAIIGWSTAYVGGANPSGKTATLGAFPNPMDGALYYSKKYFTTSADPYPRSEIPGLLHIPQSGVASYVSYGTKIPGTGLMAGRTLIAVGGGTGAALNTALDGTQATALIDITGPWR